MRDQLFGMSALFFQYRCYSLLGKDKYYKGDKGRPYQPISLENNAGGPICQHKGVVIHELLHAF